MSGLQAAKFWLMQHVGLGKDALHIYVALALFFGSALLFGWRISGWKPWALVVVAALAGEAWDIRDSLAGKLPVRPMGNLHDVWNTIFWPSVIVILARKTRVFDR